MSGPVFRISDVNVAHELIEGEAILINFTTGSYFSLEGTGAAVWQCLQAGPVSTVTLSAALAAGHTLQPAEVEQAVASVLEELEREGLIARTDAAAAELPPADTSGPFTPPTLRRYTDLEALLLLDRDHDVLPGGWPSAAPKDS